MNLVRLAAPRIHSSSFAAQRIAQARDGFLRTAFALSEWIFGDDSASQPQRRASRKLLVEMLEDRTVPSFTLPIVDQIGTTAAHSVYMVGFSVASNLYLDATGRFSDSSALTSIPPVNARAVSTITLDRPIDGGRIYFFVTPLNAPPPAFERIPATGGVVQPANPPFNALPYSIVEITVTPSNLLTIDVQTVDGFIFPLTLTTFDASMNQLGQVGQPLPPNGQNAVVNRQDIFPAYTAFMNAQGAAGAPYLPLIFNSGGFDGQPGGIVNPGLFLADGANPASALNTVWDSTLATLFSAATNLSIIGDDNVIYHGTFTTVGGRNVLQFVGGGNTFNIYDPRTPDPLAPNLNFSAGGMVFANNGVFADVSSNVVISGPAGVALGIQRDIVSALNRGIANSGPSDGMNGSTSVYWATESNWYPTGTTQNLFSLFMHTGTVNGMPIFTRPPNPATSAGGALMGQAYGFAYDESPNHALTPQPNVPSKFDPVPAATTTIVITLGPWTATPAAPLSPPNPVLPQNMVSVTGAGAGGGPQVNVYNAISGALVTSLNALPPSFTGGVRVADGDVNGDGFEDVIVGAGPGGGPQINVYDGKTFQPIRSFFGLPQAFTGGVFVASGDVNGDGFADIVVSADRGGGPQVTITSGKDGSLLASFYATAPTFTGGIRVACGDINADGFADVIAGAGPGGGPQVTIFDGRTMSLLTAFYALSPAFSGGIFVAAGDLDADGRAEVIASADAGGGPQVAIFNGTNQQMLTSFYALTPTFTGGVRIATDDTTGNQRSSIVAAAGPGGGPQVSIFDGLTQQLLRSFFAYPADFTGGVFV